MNTDKQLPVIERNFHILNDDRFIMEKISLPVEIQDGEDIHAALNRTRETIVQNFKAAYPKVEDSLNFHVVRQISPRYNPKTENFDEVIQVNKPDPKIYSSNNGIVTVDKETASQLGDKATWQVSQSDEKINKGTIEEQIQACTNVTDLSSFKLYTDLNKKYRPIFDEKFKELEQQKKCMSKKYVTVEFSGVITKVAIKTSIEGYTVGLFEVFIPDESELKKWSKKQQDTWVKENNKRMKAICKFLNENNL